MEGGDTFKKELAERKIYKNQKVPKILSAFIYIFVGCAIRKIKNDKNKLL